MCAQGAGLPWLLYLVALTTAQSASVNSTSNPVSACFANDCHPTSLCIERAANDYTCQCADTHIDRNPSYPGRQCLPKLGRDECLHPDDNECAENARCIDEHLLYRCDCLPGYVDASPANAIAGSVCRADFCADVDFCLANSTCVNEETHGECQCLNGFVDVRASPKRITLGLSNKWCLHERDVDECLLQLTNCSAVAECRDLDIGYTCACPTGLIDVNPENPGRLCGGPCAHCNGRGACVLDPVDNDIYCECRDGYSGDWCEVPDDVSVAPVPASARVAVNTVIIIPFIVLAIW